VGEMGGIASPLMCYLARTSILTLWEERIARVERKAGQVGI